MCTLKNCWSALESWSNFIPTKIAILILYFLFTLIAKIKVKNNKSVYSLLNLLACFGSWKASAISVQVHLNLTLFSENICQVSDRKSLWLFIYRYKLLEIYVMDKYATVPVMLNFGINIQPVYMLTKYICVSWVVLFHFESCLFILTW